MDDKMLKRLQKVILISFFLLIEIMACGCSRQIPVKKAPDERSESIQEPGNDLTVLTIGTADSGGTMYPVGSVIAQVISSYDPNIKVNISASNGSLTNVEALRSGQIDLGLVSGDVAFCAYNGTEEFATAPSKNIRVVAAVYSSLSNWMAPKSLGISYVHDLAGRRIAIGPKDSTTDLSAKVALSVIGLDETNTVFKNYGLGSGGMEIEKGNADALHGFAGIPVYGLSQLAESVPCRLLRYTDEELETILSENLYYYQTTIPSGTYEGQTSDVKTFGVKCLLCVDADMSDELVYRLTKILDEARPELITGHESMASIEQNSFMCQDLPIPLHPGAKTYYEDAGYLPK